jgi:hypothetical protein
VGLRTSLGDMEMGKILPLPGLELRTLGLPARSKSLIPTALSPFP